MGMVGRQFTANNSYRFGFNGKENDDEVKGEGNQQDYGMRMYDPRVGKFLSIDPLAKQYPELTPFQFASNTPIQAIDLDGMERLDMIDIRRGQRTASILVVHEVQIIQAGLAAELSALSNATYQTSFPSATVYVRNLPQNGKPIDFISRRDYNRGTGYLLNVSFEVSLSYIANYTQRSFGPEISTLEMATSNAGYTGPSAFARSSVDESNWIAVNPGFMAFAANGAAPMTGTYEELIAHEAGFHNMIGKIHQTDANNNVIYPPGLTLESQNPGSIIATTNNVKDILTTNVTTRKRLIDLEVLPKSTSSIEYSQLVPPISASVPSIVKPINDR